MRWIIVGAVLLAAGTMPSAAQETIRTASLGEWKWMFVSFNYERAPLPSAFARAGKATHRIEDSGRIFISFWEDGVEYQATFVGEIGYRGEIMGSLGNFFERSAIPASGQLIRTSYKQHDGKRCDYSEIVLSLGRFSAMKVILINDSCHDFWQDDSRSPN